MRQHPSTALALLLFAASAEAAPPALPTEVLVVPAVGPGGRSAVPVDPVALALASPDWRAPVAGDKLTVPGGVRTWAAALVKDGVVPVPLDGYAYVPVKADKAGVAVLHATGHGMVYVNGEPRVGDVYGTGYVKLPVALRAGTNDFLFAAGRGPVTVKFLGPRAAAELDAGDATLPDLRVGIATDTIGALLVRNCTAEPAAETAQALAKAR